ncbi:MAG TPA: signal recognition particle protein [Planctomycetota bacterium]|nr:signal recognition particle protein [Planctomycetota bacterium]
MFESLTQRLSGLFSRLTGGAGRLTEDSVKEAVREVKRALLEADVSLEVARAFTEGVKAKAVGREGVAGVTHAQQFVKIVHDELQALMGGETTGIEFDVSGTTVIMMVGLQGSGKTTTCGKLALWLRRKHKKTPMLVAADVQRPAAIEQLKVLGKSLDVPVHFEEGGRPPRICARAIEEARKQGCDVVILDTAGRLHIDEPLMEELAAVKREAKPGIIYLVADAMTGQDAVKSSAAFHERLSLSGVILTKLDGDARGGAALSIRHVTGCPVVFVGVGEKLDALDLFHPERMAGRILGMGDIVSLVEDAQEKIDKVEAQRVAERMFLKSFNLDDMLMQLEQVQRMGSLKDLVKKLPGQFAEALGEQELDDRLLARQKAILQSMTPFERMNPEEIHAQRRQRIARGSGTSLNDVNELLKSFKQMRKQMKEIKGTLMGRMGARQLEKQKAKMLKEMKKGRIPGLPGM